MKNTILSDESWLLKSRHIFKFSPKHINHSNFDRNGVNGLKAYKERESTGTILPTKHLRIFNCLIKIKGAINFQIKQWAEALLYGYQTKYELEEYLTSINAPEWILKATNRLKYKLYFENKKDIDKRYKEEAESYKLGKEIAAMFPDENKRLKYISSLIIEDRKNRLDINAHSSQ